MAIHLTRPFPIAAIPADLPAVERVRLAFHRIIAAAEGPEVWITPRTRASVAAEAEVIDRRVARGDRLPLAGLLVAVADDIDVADLPTNGASTEVAYVPHRSATAITRLTDAGALVLGTTNPGQYATCPSVPVAWGIADIGIGIGTDGAGSALVATALTGLIGLKPTPGLVPSTGMQRVGVDHDCLTVSALDLSVARQVLSLMTGPDEADPCSRTWPSDVILAAPSRPRVAIPLAVDLGPLESGSRASFAIAVAVLEQTGCLVQEVDISGMLEGALPLHAGALVAGHHSAAGNVAQHVVVDHLEALARVRFCAGRALAGFDGLFLPIPTEQPTIGAVQADPPAIDRRLSTGADFGNLLDLPAVAFPAGSGGDAPFGVMMVVPAFHDQVALDLAARFLGEEQGEALPGNGIELAVFGAHLRGQPLNGQLESLGGRFVGTVRTSDAYRLVALDTRPPKPGLVRVLPGEGAAISGETWLLSPAALGTLLADLPAPMSMTSVEVSDGSWMVGFGCSQEAALRGTDITEFGGWVTYLEAARSRQV